MLMTPSFAGLVWSTLYFAGECESELTPVVLLCLSYLKTIDSRRTRLHYDISSGMLV